MWTPEEVHQPAKRLPSVAAAIRTGTTLENYLLDAKSRNLLSAPLATLSYYGDQIMSYLLTRLRTPGRSPPQRIVEPRRAVRVHDGSGNHHAASRPSTPSRPFPACSSSASPSRRRTNWAPRVGIAWSPGKTGNTSHPRRLSACPMTSCSTTWGFFPAAPQFQQTVDVGGNHWQRTSSLTAVFRPALPPGHLSQADCPCADRRIHSGPETAQVDPVELSEFSVYSARTTPWKLRYLGHARISNLPVQDRINVGSVVNPSKCAARVPVRSKSGQQLNGSTNTLDSTPGNPWLRDTVGRFLAPIPGRRLPEQYRRLHADGRIHLSRPGDPGEPAASAMVCSSSGSYTWSHNIDDSTAEVFSTYTNPRRVQDFQNLRAERASSALDHRQRFTMAAVYDLPYFKTGNWFIKNLVGNWQVSPIYTYETGLVGNPPERRSTLT